MANHRKRVVLLGENRGFNHAVAAVFEGGAEVSIQDRPTAELGPVDLAVWRFDGDIPFPLLARVADETPTLVIGDEAHLLAAVDAGVRGFLPRDTSLEEVQEAMGLILMGGSVIAPDLLGTLLRHVVDRRRRADTLDENLKELTDRERDVYELAASGARKEEIGERLFISPATARTHLQRVYKKLGVHSQAELIATRSTIPTDRETPEETDR